MALVKTFRMMYCLTDFSDVRIFLLFLVLHHHDVISCHMVFNLYILWNLPKGISLQSVNAVDCLGQVLQRDYKNTMMTSL